MGGRSGAVAARPPPTGAGALPSGPRKVLTSMRFQPARMALEQVLQGTHTPDMTFKFAVVAAAKLPSLKEYTDPKAKPARIHVDEKHTWDVRARVLSAFSKPSPKLEENLNACLRQLNELAALKVEVERLRATPYDDTNKEHEATLDQVWAALEPGRKRTGGRISADWKDIGFTGNDPGTDFRGAGYLSLLSLHHVANVHTQDLRRHVASYKGNELKYWPPATTSINATRWLLEMLERGELDLALHQRGSDMETIHEVHRALLRRFALTWDRAPPPTIMGFGLVQRVMMHETRKMGVSTLMDADDRLEEIQRAALLVQ
mmetsp:Transcript_1282/g.4014  ORF Transcript_1282/g.4014 Transcript_1282/m.4014 type:complete len:318 (+) Transcript_1282:3-956(+)